LHKQNSKVDGIVMVYSCLYVVKQCKDSVKAGGNLLCGPLRLQHWWACFSNFKL